MKSRLFILVAFLFFTNVSAAAASSEIIRIYSSSGDGAITSGGAGESWATVRAGNFIEPVNFKSVEHNVYTDINRRGTAYAIRRLYLPFDTSNIPHDAVIESVRLYVIHPHTNYNSSDGISLGVLIGSQTDLNILSTSDWSPGSFSRASSDRSISSLDSNNQLITWEFNDYGVNSIKFGANAITSIVLATSADIDDDETTLTGTNYADIYLSESTSTSTDPYLEISYTIPDNATSLSELVVILLEYIENNNFKKQVKNSYLAHLKKIEDFYDFGRYTAARNQLNQFVSKITQDREQGFITDGQFGDMFVYANDILEFIVEAEESEDYEDRSSNVPLITQIASPYPPESADWENDLLGNGLPDWCGNTIGGCGCAISSLAMVAQGYGIQTDRDGNKVNPQNLNEWLYENNGYTPNNSVLWYYALQYLSKKDGFSQLQLDHLNTSDQTLIDTYLNQSFPAIGFKENKGHYLVLTNLLEGGGYGVRDPLWYLTTTTNDVKDVANHMQEYGNSIDQVNLFSFSKQPTPFPKWVEIHLGSPAELLITDSEGRRTGYDPDTGEVFTEIPDSSYVQTVGVVSQDDLPNIDHLNKVLAIHNPTGDLFDLRVIGTDEGAYDLTIATNGGEDATEIESLHATTSLGVIDQFAIDIPDKEGQSHAAARLREVADQKSEDQSAVAEKLRAIADKLDNKNVAILENSLQSLLD